MIEVICSKCKSKMEYAGTINNPNIKKNKLYYCYTCNKKKLKQETKSEIFAEIIFSFIRFIFIILIIIITILIINIINNYI